MRRLWRNVNIYIAVPEGRVGLLSLLLTLDSVASRYARDDEKVCLLICVMPICEYWKFNLSSDSAESLA